MNCTSYATFKCAVKINTHTTQNNTFYVSYSLYI